MVKCMGKVDTTGLPPAIGMKDSINRISEMEKALIFIVMKNTKRDFGKEENSQLIRSLSDSY